MYFIVKPKKTKRKKKVNIESIQLGEGILFGVRGKKYKISDDYVCNLMIYNKKLGHPIAWKQVEKKYQKLISTIPDLLVSDDESGESIREALNQIEKFRQIIKNKYRSYLKRQELEKMANSLLVLQKNAQDRLMEIYKARSPIARHSSYR